MDFEKYKEEVKILEKKFESDKIKLMKIFVNSNNTYKVGESVTDHIGTILIESMGYSWGSFGSPPNATYTGVELNKDGKPNKRLTKRTIWQDNVL